MPAHPAGGPGCSGEKGDSVRPSHRKAALCLGKGVACVLPDGRVMPHLPESIRHRLARPRDQPMCLTIRTATSKQCI